LRVKGVRGPAREGALGHEAVPLRCDLVPRVAHGRERLCAVPGLPDRGSLVPWPIGGRRDVAARVDIEVERLGGDASMDVKIDTEYRLYDFSQFIPFMLPILVTGYYVSGKVIRYTGTDCGAG
jgi:hypothetical protein